MMPSGCSTNNLKAMETVPKSVLFVCTGNTCRSPMAEGLFRKYTHGLASIQHLGSAGVSAFGGDPMSEYTREILEEEGLTDTHAFRSRPVNQGMMEEADFVFVMTYSHLNLLQSAFPEYADKCSLVCDYTEFDGVKGRDLPDPYGQSRRAYEKVAQVLNHCFPDLVSHIESAS